MAQFQGQIASEGFIDGPAFILKNRIFKPSQKPVHERTLETKGFEFAVSTAKSDLLALQKIAETKKSQGFEIIEAHLMLLEDPEVMDLTLGRINNGEFADLAYFNVIEEFRNMFLQVSDELIRQRAIDLHDIRQRVLFYIQNPGEKFPDLYLDKPAILIATDLTPSQILNVQRENLLGFVTAEGSPTSHTSILARSLEVPAIVGLPTEILFIKNETPIYIDNLGALLIDPNQMEIEAYLARKNSFLQKKSQDRYYYGRPSVTADGTKLTLAANISGPQDLPAVVKNDAESVGLYRTEFLFLDRQSAPTENEQYEVYKQVFAGLGDKHILVRTLDIGGDKKADYLRMKPEENPFLGVRALRLCFQRPEIFKTQLRALLRAGPKANWGLMFPMVSQLEELILAKSFVAEVKNELRAEGLEFSEKFQIGIMIEIPSAAWMIDVFTKHVDFVSVGTNDLLQYTCAADRLNPDLKNTYNSFNPGFLRQIHHVLTTCAEAKVHSGICGSLSHHPELMAFFIGCGVNELSMTSQHILPTRSRLAKLNLDSCKKLVQRVLHQENTAGVKDQFLQLFDQSN